MTLLFLLFGLTVGLCPSMAPNVPSEEDIFQLTQTSSLYDGKYVCYIVSSTTWASIYERPCSEFEDTFYVLAFYISETTIIYDSLVLFFHRGDEYAPKPGHDVKTFFVLISWHVKFRVDFVIIKEELPIKKRVSHRRRSKTVLNRCGNWLVIGFNSGPAPTQVHAFLEVSETERKCVATNIGHGASMVTRETMVHGQCSRV